MIEETMSYSMIRKELGADLWDTITGAFTGTTGAIKSGASTAWAATKSAASAAYQEDLKKHMACQQQPQLDGLGALVPWSGDIYYDTETGECVQLSKDQQIASCNENGGVWTAQQYKGKTIFGCMPKADYDKIPKKGTCLPNHSYSYGQAVKYCGADKDDKFQKSCAASGGNTVWTTFPAAGGPTAGTGFLNCDCGKGRSWNTTQGQCTSKSNCAQPFTVDKGGKLELKPGCVDTRYTEAPKGFGGTTGKPQAFVMPADAPILYPTPEASPEEVSARQIDQTQQMTSPAPSGGITGWWSERSTPEKVGIVGGGAVVALTAIYLIVR